MSILLPALGLLAIAVLFARSVLAGPECETSWTSAASGAWNEATNWSAGVPSASTKACILVSGSYTVTVTGSQSVGSLTLGGGTNQQRLLLSASSGAGNATLTAHGDVANTATIAMTDPDASGEGKRAMLELESGKLTNEGAIVSEPGAAGLGERALNGTVTNGANGTIDVKYALYIDRAAATTFATSGTVKVESGQTLYVDHSGTPGSFVIEGGKIEDAGTIYDHTLGPGPNSDGGHGTLEAKAGTITGGPVIANGVTADLAGSGSGTIELGGPANELAGAEIGAGYTLEPYALNENGFSDAVVTAASGFTNHGTIDLVDQEKAGEYARNARLVVSSGTLTNEGTIIADPGEYGQGTRTIEGNLTNAAGGTIDVNTELGIDSGAAATFATSGTVKVESGQTLYVDHSGTPGSFVIEGGKIEDAGTIYDHTLGPGPNSDGGHGTLEAKAGTITGGGVIAVNVNASLNGGGSGTFTLGGGSNTLSGNIGAGYRLAIEGSSENGFGTAVVTATSGFTNHGTIDLTNDSASSSNDSRLVLSSGTLSNEGTIVADRGTAAQGTRTIEGSVSDGASGTVAVKQSLSIAAGGFLANAGTVTVAAGTKLAVAGSYSQSAGSTQLGGAGATLAPGGEGALIEGGELSGPGTIEGNLSNAGRTTVAAASPGTLAVTGNYQQAPAGVLAAGVTPTGADQLAVSGQAILAGRLGVSTASGFTPALGHTYQIIKAASVSGTFAQATGLVTGPYSVGYESVGVTLTVVAASNFPAFSINSPTIVRGSGDELLTFTVTLSKPVTGGASVEYATADGSARAPGDYAPASGTLTFNTGETSKTILVVVHGSAGPGPDETMYVDLSNAQNALIAQERGTGTIENDNMTLASVTPSSSGNTGEVTVEYLGSGFTHHQTVALTRAGQAPITPASSSVNAEGTDITATFELAGAAEGAWTPVVSIPEGPSASLPGGFKIEGLRRPNITAQLLGTHWAPANYPWTGILQYTNTGNVDATGAVLEINGFNRGATVEVAPAPGSSASFNVLPRRSAEESGVDIALQRVPALSTGNLLVTFTPVGSETEVYRLSVQTLASGASPSAAATAGSGETTFAGELLSESGGSFSALLHVTSPGGSGDAHVDFSSVPPYRPAPVQYTTAPEAGGLTRAELRGAVPPPQEYPPGRRPPLRVTVALSSEYTAERAGTDTLTVIGGHNVISAGQTVAGAKEVWKSYTEKERELEINNCLATLNLLTPQQAEEAQRLAEANSFAQWVSTAASWVPGLGSIATKNLTALTAVTNSAWSNFVFGGLGSNGALGGANEEYLNELAFLTPAERFAFVTRELCPEQEKPNRNRELTPEAFKKELEHTPGTKLYELGMRVPGDPNEITGPAGYGRRRFIQAREPLAYEVSFENKPTATASASEVKVALKLDPHRVDLSTLTLGSVYLGLHAIAAPPGVSSWTGTLDMRPTINLLVRVTAALDKRTGLLTWDLLAINPATGQPASPLEGFLPPNKRSPEGQGGVTFTVLPKRGLRTGAVIKQRASIVFNRNAAIATPTWTNTIDTSVPSSRVVKVRHGRGGHCPNVTVTWTGRDRGAPIAYFKEYVSRDHHRFQLWRVSSRRRGLFKPAPGRHRYRFESLAVNGVGHRQHRPSRATRPITVSCAARRKR